jgi:hypothetical protein
MLCLHDPRSCIRNAFTVKLEYTGLEPRMYCIISFYDMKTRARLCADGHGVVSMHDKSVTIGPVSCTHDLWCAHTHNSSLEINGFDVQNNRLHDFTQL